MRPAPRLAATLAVPAALVLAALARLAPPPARPANAPAPEFSAERALATVRELAGDGIPRPVGSAADRRAVARLVSRFRALGLETSVQATFGCGPYGACALVRNVVARLGAPAPGRRAVLLVAHHDSVGAGPGAADDAAGAAALVEVARALSEGPPLPRPVVFLVTDGEEAALAGAAAFVDRHPFAREAGAVVNLEARGTEGPSVLFETSGAPAWLADALDALPRPVTTSVAPALYALLPNDTDLSVFQRAGTPGVNLAFALGAARYHTPRDDVAHLDLGSLQHQGDAALALVHALAAADLDDAVHPRAPGTERGSAASGQPAARPRAWLDVLSLGVLSWPWPREVALAAALLALGAAAVLVRREARPLGAAAWGLAAAVLGPLLAASAAAILLVALRWAGAIPRLFVAHPAPVCAAGWLAGAAGALLAPALLGRRAGRPGLLAGSALVFAALSAGLALALPLATPLVVLPALAFAAAEALRAFAPPGGGRAWVADVLPPAAAALAIGPVALLLPPVMGIPAVAAAALLSALLLAPAAAAALDPDGPPRLRPGLLALAAAALLAAVQATRPQATADAPERLTFAFHQTGGTARWLAEAERDGLPGAVRAAAPFSARRAPAFPWTPTRLAFAALSARRAPAFPWTPTRLAFSAPAPPLGLAPPRVELLSVEAARGIRRVRARLSSPRGAPVVALFLPASAQVLSATLDGVPLPEPPRLARRFFGGHRLLASMTTPPRGVTVEVAFAGEAPVAAVVADQSPGLPPGGAPLAAARPATAAPSWDGDVTVATSAVRL